MTYLQGIRALLRLKQCLLSTICLRFFKHVDKSRIFFKNGNGIFITTFCIKNVVFQCSFNVRMSQAFLYNSWIRDM